jgi:hypothetical protein
VQICLCHVNVAIDLPGLPQIPAPVTDQSCAATSSANTLIGVGGPHAPPSCANLHSARRSRRLRLPFPAGSLYGLCQGGVSMGDRSAHLFSFVSFFVRSESPFLRPDPHFACAGAHRSCQGWPSHQPFPTSSAVARPHLDSFEHDGTLGAIGMTIRGEPAFGRDQSRHNLVSGGSKDPNHDAVMRIGSEAPRRRTHSSFRH